MADDEDGGSRIGFSLPPIRLPRIRFPDGLRFLVPEWATGERNVLLAAVVLDIGDAIVILALRDSVVRAFVGTAAMALLHGPLGLIYAIELLPTILGVSWIAVMPTATLVTYYRRSRA